MQYMHALTPVRPYLANRSASSPADYPCRTPGNSSSTIVLNYCAVKGTQYTSRKVVIQTC